MPKRSKSRSRSRTKNKSGPLKLLKVINSKEIFKSI